MTTAILEKSTDTLREPTREFSFHDRCDRCGFQGYVVAQMETCESVLELVFCGHHGRTHTPALAQRGWTVLDFTDRINEKPSPSASEID